MATNKEAKDSKDEVPKDVSKDAASDDLKAQIQAQMDQAREIQRQQMLKKRVELAKQGVQNLELMKLADSAKAYHTYLALMEEWKGVREGGLHPKLFDKKKDITEILLISGIYWDLTTIYDRTKSRTRLRDLTHFMDQFVLFSLGMQFQPVATELLRKYIANGKPIHKALFKKAYSRLQPEKCFVTGALSEEVSFSDVEALRRFRDRVLKRNAFGQRVVDWYYLRGPGLARLVQGAPREVKSVLSWGVRRLARLL